MRRSRFKFSAFLGHKGWVAHCAEPVSNECKRLQAVLNYLLATHQAILNKDFFDCCMWLL